ncbi:MAG: PDZ domain-containing protein, partial [Nitrospinaceae bacterium]|nr:PDZ domain-containing protein [Nitrospinaceae bacterium]
MIFRLLSISVLSLCFLVSGAQGAVRSESALREIEGVFIGIAERVKPAVVSIRSESRVSRPARRAPKKNPGNEKGKPPKPHPNLPRFSSGSGFIVDPEGYILTNNHVVSNSRRLRVRLSDKSEYWARVIGTDPYTDLALIKIDAPTPLPMLKLGDSEKVKVGQWSIAVGDPFGITRTFTVGVVSGMGRTGVGVARYEYFIQTDAAINRGNSGGPLLNIDGEVIGINTAIPAPGSGLGFSIPINMARDVMKYLRRLGTFPRGYLGVTIQPVGNDMAHLLGLKSPSGALVGSLLKDGPAMHAGVKAGDVIVEIDGKYVDDTAHLQRLVGWTPPGKAVNLNVVRYGRKRKLTVKLTKLPDSPASNKKPLSPGPTEPAQLGSYGMSVETLSPALMKKNLLTKSGGVYINEVEPGSRAFRDGVRVGMVIREFTYRAPGGRTAPVRVPISGLDEFEGVL